ncbi:hypothetical protein PLICRDRAFT_180523 [Plicaturopsis crispa FD-325 SS-3]|uniref:Uncharacterized protein n=1 Tax=Plicaturopsis crispa FD-325 SS-3 TaxID=944288 RepID=A0A0C9T233_PLICR|nr:hypothetical protein PLICRDRAFT_180523 [Plicaturopsis crispa FD-325 SS-3]
MSRRRRLTAEQRATARKKTYSDNYYKYRAEKLAKQRVRSRKNREEKKTRDQLLKEDLTALQLYDSEATTSLFLGDIPHACTEQAKPLCLLCTPDLRLSPFTPASVTESSINDEVSDAPLDDSPLGQLKYFVGDLRIWADSWGTPTDIASSLDSEHHLADSRGTLDTWLQRQRGEAAKGRRMLSEVHEACCRAGAFGGEMAELVSGTLSLAHRVIALLEVHVGYNI